MLDKIFGTIAAIILVLLLIITYLYTYDDLRYDVKIYEAKNVLTESDIHFNELSENIVNKVDIKNADDSFCVSAEFENRYDLRIRVDIGDAGTIIAEDELQHYNVVSLSYEGKRTITSGLDTDMDEQYVKNHYFESELAFCLKH